METGDPETEINCQVSGAEGAGYVTTNLCVSLLGGVWREQEAALGSITGCPVPTPPPKCHLPTHLYTSYLPEAGLRLEFDE